MYTNNPYIQNLLYGEVMKESLMEDVKKLKARLGLVEDDISEEPKFNDETWVWVEGFKGTNKDMQGHGNYQFEIGKRYDMPDDVKIVDCHAGFHLSLRMKDVFKHYDIGDGNRFFKVRALVRKSDYEKYGEKIGNGYFGPQFKDKLASKSIEFIEELGIDEIFWDTDHADWSEEKKKLALIKDIKYVEKEIEVDELVELGYSRPFAAYIVHDQNRGKAAKAVASQPDLSMDMKCLMILEW